MLVDTCVRSISTHVAGTESKCELSRIIVRVSSKRRGTLEFVVLNVDHRASRVVRLTWQMIAFVRRLPAMLWDRYLALSITNQRLVCAYLAIHVVGLVAVIILSPSYIFGVFSQWAKSLRMNDYGYLYLLAVIILTAFPPMVGYGTCISLCGFAFGAQKGWLIAATGCVTGALLSFMYVLCPIHLPCI